MDSDNQRMSSDRNSTHMRELAYQAARRRMLREQQEQQETWNKSSFFNYFYFVRSCLPNSIPPFVFSVSFFVVFLFICSLPHPFLFESSFYLHFDASYCERRITCPWRRRMMMVTSSMMTTAKVKFCDSLCLQHFCHFPFIRNSSLTKKSAQTKLEY